MNFKKILTLLGLLVVTGAVGFALYWLFFAPPAPPEEVVNAPPVAAPPSAGLPPAAVGVPPVAAPPVGAPLPVSPVAAGGLTVVKPVAAAPTVGAAVSPSGDLSYYNRNDGKFYRVAADGKVAALSNKTFFNVDKATFDPRGNKAILEYPDGANILFDFATNTQVTLPKHWEDFNFSSQGDQIAAKSIGLDPNARFLIVAKPDGSSAKAIQELGNNADKVTVAWSPNNQVVGFAETGEQLGVDRQEIFFLGQNQENFKSMVVEGMDFRPQWAPRGEKLLYSVAGSGSDYKPALWLVDADGDNIGKNRRSLNVNTWADKCTFKDDSILICAIPEELPEGAGLQPAVADETPDSIYQIDITTGLQTRLAVPEGSHTVETLMVSPDGSALYFTDKGTGIINQIAL